jgi:hypothetical protein
MDEFVAVVRLPNGLTQPSVNEPNTCSFRHSSRRRPLMGWTAPLRIAFVVGWLSLSHSRGEP